MQTCSVLKQPTQSCLRRTSPVSVRRQAAHRCRAIATRQPHGDADLLRAVLEQHLTDINEPAAVSSCVESDALLDLIYDVLDHEVFFSKGAFVIPGSEKKRIDATGGSASYGEVQAAGIDQLMRWATKLGCCRFIS
eukprot:GHUV01040214.1.p1 GENE.GHUV01040214.1~~GHUV01040214.1.p1  ORF type:complete len:136 (+),score=31.45 GHUV01040214.1:261-668(+)